MTTLRLDAEAFERLATEMRPALHRYCARMMGSAFDGEDVVQDALMKAAQSFAGTQDIERPKGWLFRIAHNTALDALRRRRRKREVPLGRDAAEVQDVSAADERVAAAANLASFLALPPAQRSCVVMVDVLGYELAETAAILGLTLAGAKAALHRGRLRLREVVGLPEGSSTVLSAEQRRRLEDYADRFNARDFDALKDLLAEDVRLDLANRRHLTGKKDVSVYFTRYDGASDWRFYVGLAEKRLALLVRDPGDRSEAIRHVVLLDWAKEKIARIRDYKYAPYVIEGMPVSELGRLDAEGPNPARAGAAAKEIQEGRVARPDGKRQRAGRRS